jgi:hypothetical protein
MNTDQDHFNACRLWQEQVDNHLQYVGGRAPQPVIGQKTNNYVRETCRTLKRTFLPQNHELYRVQWRELPGDALQALVPQLLDACVKEAENPDTVTPGEFRQVKVHNPYTGRVDAIKFIGPESFVKAMGRPGRLAKIRTPDTHPGWFPKEVPSVWLSGARLQVA